MRMEDPAQEAAKLMCTSSSVEHHGRFLHPWDSTKEDMHMSFDASLYASAAVRMSLYTCVIESSPSSAAGTVLRRSWHTRHDVQNGGSRARHAALASSRNIAEYAVITAIESCPYRCDTRRK